MEGLVVHGNSSRPWVDYICREVSKRLKSAHLPKDGIRFSNVDTDTFIRRPHQEQQRLLNKTQVLTLILSPDFVEAMEVQTRMDWNRLIPDMRRVVCVRCGTTDEELDLVRIRLPCDSDCTWVDAAIKPREIVDSIMDIYHIDQNPHSSPGSKGNLDKAVKAPSKTERSQQNKKQHKQIYICPTSGQCYKMTDVIFVIEEKGVNSENLLVVLEGTDEHNRQVFNLKQISETAYVCSVGENSVGKVQLKVMCGERCLGTASFTFVSQLRELEELSQNFTSMLELTVKSRVNDASSLSALDEELCGTIQHRDLRGFSRMFQLYHYYDDLGQSRHEFPTLLHFAARFGLQELCSFLIDMKGAVAAANVCNKQGLTAVDLAREHGHRELVEYLEGYSEIAQDEESIYQMMYNYAHMEDIHLQENYYNTRRRYRGVSGIPHQAEEEEDYYVDVGEDNPYIPMTKQKDTEQPVFPPMKTTQDPFSKREMEEASDRAQGAAVMGKKDVSQQYCTRSRSQQELIDIMEGVKRGEFTMDEADDMFRTWQDHYRSSNMKNSFHQKKESLKRRKTEVTNAQSSLEQGKSSGTMKGIKTFLGGFYRKKSTLPESPPKPAQAGQSRQYRRYVPPPKNDEEEEEDRRTSTCSNSSQSSGGSRTSASSLTSQSDHADSGIGNQEVEPASPPPRSPRPRMPLPEDKPSPARKPPAIKPKPGGKQHVRLDISSSPMFQKRKGDAENTVTPSSAGNELDEDFEDRISSIPLESPPPPPIQDRNSDRRLPPPIQDRNTDGPPPPIPPRRPSKYLH